MSPEYFEKYFGYIFKSKHSNRRKLFLLGKIHKNG